MRRIITTSIASSLLALAVPAAASAHGSVRHQAHHRHHRRAHTVVFTHGAARTVPGTSAPVTPTTPPTEGEPAGTITSFEGGVLKITLADGSVVSGKVTEATRIECATSGGREDNGDGNDQSDQNDQGDSQDGVGPSSGHGDFGHGDDERGGVQGDDDQTGEGEAGEGACGPAALKPGAKVTEAELAVTSAGSSWEKVELAQ